MARANGSCPARDALGGRMFSNKAREKTIEHEVLLEMEFLRKLHGDEAPRIAAGKAVRPENRTHRRLVLEEVARRLAGQDRPARRSFIGRLLGQA